MTYTHLSGPFYRSRPLFPVLLAASLSLANGASIKRVWPSKGSTAGGTYLTIHGSGFQFPSEFNPWDSQTVTVGSVRCKIVQHYTTSTQITCVTGPAQLYESSGLLDVTVQIFSGLAEAHYATAKNAFWYDAGSTPNFFWGSKWASAGGKTLTFGGEYLAGAHNADRFEIKIGDTKCTTDEETKPLFGRRRRGGLQTVSCEFPEDEAVLPGQYNLSFRLTHVQPTEDVACPNAPCFDSRGGDANGYGNGVVAISQVDHPVGHLRRVWAGVPDFKTGKSYTFLVHPEIQSISLTEGGLYGGQELRIRGSTFTPAPEENEVQVGDIPCRVISANSTEIVCRLGNSATDATGAMVHSLGGLLVREWDSRYNRWYAHKPETVPDEADREAPTRQYTTQGRVDYPGQENAERPRTDRTFHETKGFFVPTLTANYTWFLSGDDYGGLYIGMSSSEATLSKVAWFEAHISRMYGSFEEFFERQGLQGEHIASHRQIAETMQFVAGQRYPFVLRGSFRGGADWLRLGLRIHNLSQATLVDGSFIPISTQSLLKRHYPAMSSQMIRLKMTDTLRRESHSIRIGDDSDPEGDFRLAIVGNGGQRAFKTFGVDATAEDIETWVTEAQQEVLGETPVKIHSCDNIAVSSEIDDEEGATYLVVTFLCPLQAGKTEWVSFEVLEMFNSNVTATMEQPGSLPLGGTWRVGLDGQWTEPIDVRSRAIRDAVSTGLRRSADSELGISQIEVECWQTIESAPSAGDGEGFSVFVNIRYPNTELPPLEIDASMVTGEDYEFEVVIAQQGDDDGLFLDRVPLDLFEMPMPSDAAAMPVRVVSSGIAASSADGTSFGFKYQADLSPTLLEISPATVELGAVLALAFDNIKAGNETEQDVEVEVGGVPCVNVTVVDVAATFPDLDAKNDTQAVTCIVGSIHAGNHNVTFRSKSQGVVDPSAVFTVEYQVTIGSIAPLTGSLAGGTLMTFVGDGFDRLPCAMITIGGEPCAELPSTGIPAEYLSTEGLQCLSPALPSFDNSSNPTSDATTYDVDVLVLLQASAATEVRGTFTYDPAKTPYIQDLTPTQTSAALSNTYTMTGHTLVDTEGESPVVMFNNRPCEVHDNSETEITCWLLRASPEPPALRRQRPQIWVPGLGYAATAEAVETEYRFEVHSISPSVVSTAGGAMVRISGAGFHPSLPEMSEITFDLPDGTQLPCNVLSETSKEISCEIAGGVSAPMAYSRRLAVRRLQENNEPDVAVAPGGIAHDCFEGGADHSKGHCFAKAVMRSGRVRSLHGASHHHTLEPKLKQLVDKKRPGHDLPTEKGLLATGSSATLRMLRELTADTIDDGNVTDEDLGWADEDLDLDWLDHEERVIGGKLTISMNSVPARCDTDYFPLDSNESVCDFAMHDEVSPKVFDISPTEGSFAVGTEVFVRLLGVVDVSAPHVFFGDVECPVSEAYYHIGGERIDDMVDAQASFDADEMVVSVLKVPVCQLPASTHPIYVRLDPLGYSHRASPYTRSEFYFTQHLEFSSVEPTSGSFFGGGRVSLLGAGFSTEAANSRVLVGGLPCEIAEVRNNSVIDCYLPSHPEGGDVTREVRLDILTRVPPAKWQLGMGFYSCLGSEFGENDPGAEPEPESEAEPEPETEPEPEAETELEPGVVGFTVTGDGNIRMHKAECMAASGTAVDAHTKVPAGASSVGVSFKYIEPCLGNCAPLRVAYYDADEPTNQYQWCLLSSSSTGSVCDAEEYGMDEDIWYVRKFEVGPFAEKFGYRPERLMLRLEVFGFELMQTTFINEVIFEETSRLLNCTYGPLASAPNISAMVAPSDESTIAISGARFGSEAGIVSIGADATVSSNFACVITSWSDTAIECEKPLLPAGGWVLRVWVPGVGWSNTPDDLIWVTTTLTEVEVNGDIVSAADNNTVGELGTGLGGEVELTLRGQGLGLMPANMEIAICGEPCRITEAIDTTAAKCVTPIRRSSLMLDTHPKIFPVAHLALNAVRFYTDRGLAEGHLSQEAFTSGIDRDVRLQHNGQWNLRSGCWFGFELALHKQALVTSVEFFPPTVDERRAMTSETVFEVRNLTEPSEWVKVGGLEDAVISGWTIAPGWNVFPVDPPVLAQAFRVRILPDACQSSSYGGSLMRGARFRGMFLDYQDSSSCDIQLRRVSHPLASFTGVQVPVHAVLQHAVDRTPVVNLVTPNRGTARGLTLVAVLGANLDPLGSGGEPLDEAEAAAAAEVTFNGYPCEVQSANATAITCLTGERGVITPPSTRVWVGGRGLAILDGKDDDIYFKYIDKWSNIYSWLNSEPPIDGDSVVVPEGQAILLDKNSPLLFFVLVSGLLEFDRRDLMFNATYIWIAGGHFMVGTEQSPFLHQATITLFGDRWWTTELPFTGSKMIAITNLGGLHGGCHSEALRINGEGATPCYVRSVGKLDLHGRPGISWTRLVQTAEAGSTRLRLEEAVDWPLGVRIIITQTSGGLEEIRHVKALYEDGFVVEIDKPLTKQHLGEWYFHDSFEGGIDLRAAVGLHQRNIKVQGDESALRPGNSYLFGAHMAVMFGGEMRVENTEYTRTGQSANFGRYSSHWHNLSPGRTVDVADKAYLRNNTYHNTFQRAVVVHGTDYCVVRDNIAHRTKGHSFFTEAGDEHFAYFEHNLAVSPQKHPVLLEDDITPAGFWLPGFTGWHFNNLAVNCARGWRVQTLGPIGSAQPKLEFFNNSAHACGFGWHLKPPHAPPQLNVFRDFTAFRCNTGMFYYGTGNIRHENHRFVECSTGHFMNHLSNGLHTDPFYTNLILVGNIDHTSPWPRVGLGVRGPKDNEYFFISGMKTISFFDRPALSGCFDTMCTMRMERCEWYDSSRYTDVPPPRGGIVWDLDGTMTGYTNGFVSPRYAFNRLDGVCSEQAEHPGALVCGDAAGETRVRRLLVDRPDPWQLDRKYMDVKSEHGEEQVPWTMLKLEGWAIPVISGGNYTLRPDVANDFEDIRIKYSSHPYVTEEHGWMAENYTRAQPISESLAMVWPFNQWRNHFDTDPPRERLDRLPGKGDPWGAFSMRVFRDMCEPYNLTNESDEKCGPWVNETGWDLKKELEENMSLAEPNGEMASFLDMVAPDFPDFADRLTYYARECPVGGCPTPPPPAAPNFGDRRMWSDPLGWPSGKVPEADEHVDIVSGDWVVLDMETPVHWWVTVEGHLEFSREHRAVLHCNAMKVWGSVDMGTDEDPIPQTAHAEIVLYGGEDSHTVIMTEGLFLGNKVVAIVGNFSAAGTPVSPNAWTKLVDTAASGATTLTLRGNMSAWPAGYDIALGATEYPEPPAETQTEVRTILLPPVYDADTDTTVMKIDAPLDFRHFAGDVAGEEGGHWPSTRLAAAVSLLGGRSNVIFRSAGEETYHGGGIVIAGSADGVWVGEGSFTDVDFVGMGKFYYEAPALKFLYLEDSIGQNRPSHVLRCTFTQSQAGAIEVNGARDLELHDNTFHKTYRTALWITKTTVSRSMSIIGNVAIETLRHPRETELWWSPFAAFFIEVEPLELRGNLAAGSTDSGFVIRPQMGSCQTNTPLLQEYELNEAVGCVTGFFVLKAPTITTCVDCDRCGRVSGTVAWKNAHMGVNTVDQPEKMRIEALFLSDNHIGIAMTFFRRLDPEKDFQHRVYYTNLTVFGSTAASTGCDSTACRALGPADMVGTRCNSVAPGYRRVGVMTHIMNDLPKLCELNGKITVCRPPNTPVKQCVLPWESREGTQGARYSEGHFDGVTMGHFVASECSKKSAAFMLHPESVHAPVPQFFKNVRYLGAMEHSARLVLDGSGRAMDDGVQQAFFVDLDGSLIGTGLSGGTVVSRRSPELATGDCQSRPGHFACDELKLRYLTWSAVGSPEHRVLGPFKAWRASDNRATWSSGPKRGECLPPMKARNWERGWAVKTNEMYNLTLFASPPKHHRLRFLHDDPTEAVRMDIFLAEPFRLEVYVDGVLVDDALDKSQDPNGARYPNLDDEHGAYAFDPHQRRFYLTLRGQEGAREGRKDVFLRLLQVVQLSLELSIPVTEFDGPALISNVATLLQIPAHRIKIVSVQSRAQVANQQGRRLQDGTGLVVQIIEDAPPVSESMLNGNDPEEVVIGGDDTEDNTTTTEANATNGSNDSTVEGGGLDITEDFSIESNTELLGIASMVTAAATSGALSEALGSEVIVEVEVSDPEEPIAVDPQFGDESNDTSTSTSTTSGAPMEVPVPEGDYIQLRFADLNYDLVDHEAFKAELLAQLDLSTEARSFITVNLYRGSIIAQLLAAPSILNDVRLQDLASITVMGYSPEVTVLDPSATTSQTSAATTPTPGGTTASGTQAPGATPAPGGEDLEEVEEEEEEQKEDESKEQIMAIITGAVIGGLLGPLTMAFGYYVVRKRAIDRTSTLIGAK